MADGGNVYKGKSYLVGEEGPERFVSDQGGSMMVGKGGPEKFTPGSKGSIEPNGEGGGAPQVTIANIIDPAMINEWANSSDGQAAIINVISNNPDALQQAIK